MSRALLYLCFFAHMLLWGIQHAGGAPQIDKTLTFLTGMVFWVGILILDKLEELKK